MHKYQPRIHLVRRPRCGFSSDALTSLPTEEIKTFEFPETVFIAVTAYQNQLVSSLPVLELVTSVLQEDGPAFCERVEIHYRMIANELLLLTTIRTV